MQKDLINLAQDGVLRVAINTGNRALVQHDNGVLSGVGPALAERLAGLIGARVKLVIYSGAGKVFEDADKNVWDVAFLAIDEMRAEKVGFTRAYVSIEATYAVRTESSFQDVSHVDIDGVKVLTAAGSAYDMYLTSTLQHATLDRFGNPHESFEAFRNGRCDAVAGIRASLMLAFNTDPDIRILPGVLTRVEQAMVLPDRRDQRIIALDDFVFQAMQDGFVAHVLSRTTTK